LGIGDSSGLMTYTVWVNPRGLQL